MYIYIYIYVCVRTYTYPNSQIKKCLLQILLAEWSRNITEN